MTHSQGSGPDERRLRAERAFWQSTVDALPHRIAVLDEDGEILAVNEAWRREAAILGHVGASAFDAPLDAETAARLRAVLAGERASDEVERRIGGRWWRLRADRFEDGPPLRVVVHHEDITERREAEERARLRARLLDEVDAAVIATARDRVVTAWNAGAERLFGWSAAEVLGRPITEIMHVDDREAMAAMGREVESRGTADAEIVVRDRHGRAVPIYTRRSLLYGDGGEPGTQISISLDVSERHRYRRDLEAARDYLSAVTSSMGDGLIVIAADGRVALANAAAAELLRAAPADLPGRDAQELLHGPGGAPLEPGRGREDEFVRADGTRMPVTWTLSPLAAGDGEQVLVFHDASERRTREERLRREAAGLRLAADIRLAVDEDRFELLAQPIVELAAGEVVSHELLLRLRDADTGALLAPGAFLPAAEEHGLMADVDRWVLRRAVELVAGRPGRSVHVNVSAQSVGDAGVLSALADALEIDGVEPSRIVVEVTETALMGDDDTTRAFLRRLRGIGCGVALDDFGTGYSGLARVTHAPVDALKIDGSFVRGLLTDPVKESVVRAIVSLASDLGAVTVAEGVEDQATLERVKALGVGRAQGYHLGRPAPLD